VVPAILDLWVIMALRESMVRQARTAVQGAKVRMDETDVMVLGAVRARQARKVCRANPDFQASQV
jgi:hypothetical protein